MIENDFLKSFKKQETDDQKSLKKKQKRCLL